MNLKFSRRGDYVVRSAIYLARSYGSPEPKKLREVALAMDIPRTYVPQILGDLVQAGVATSYFGTKGGYQLSRDPREISLLEVIEAGEGAMDTGQCVLGGEPCSWESVCAMHEAWTIAVAGLRAELGSTSLATLAERDQAITAGTYEFGLDPRGVETVEVADTVQVELAAAHVVDWLQASDGRMTEHLDAAQSDGEDAVARIRPTQPRSIARTTTVHVGDPRNVDDARIMAFTWEATGPSGLFPRFIGTIGVLEIDARRTEVTVSGHYRASAGRSGQTLDDSTLRDVAETTLRSLLLRLARGVEHG